MTRLPPISEMRRACREKDAGYDGVFFLAVRTTGVFCRPSCPARPPKPQNVEYFPTTEHALRAGYRPCKRCRPLDVNGRPPAWVRRLLQTIERSPHARLRDADLRAMAVDPARARRFFRRNYGMTFHAYQRAHRLGEAFTRIRRGDKLAAVTIGHGYESQSGFRDAFAKTFGAPPGRRRPKDCLCAEMIESPVGPLVACASAEAVCLLEFTDRRALEAQFSALRDRFEEPVVPGRNARLRQLRNELDEYFAGRRRRFTVPLSYPGTPFQEAVWKCLLQIPYGGTLSYEQLAAEVGRPGAQRAVGRANGQNRLAILIPCHRVVNKSGELGGYGGGLWRKRFLLDLEQGQHALQPTSD